MGGLNVKITILERLFSALTPDLCYSCGKIGASFCSYCKYDITHEFVAECFWCGASNKTGVCHRHGSFIDAVYVVGSYKGGLKRALHGLKFQRDRYLVRTFTEMLEALLPTLPHDTVVVPVPTLSGNVRRRGYDHVAIIAKMIAKSRQLEFMQAIERHGVVIQHATSSRAEREVQVKGMFKLVGARLPEVVLLVDDIITTGSTVQEIASQLRVAGVKHVIVAAIARTP